MLKTMGYYRRCENRGYYAVEGLVIGLWMAAIMAVVSVGRPVHRGFFCDDQSIMYPYAPNTVPNALITSLTLAAPVFIMCAIELARCFSGRSPPVSHRPSSPRGRRGRGRGGKVVGRQEGGGWCVVVGAYVVYFFGFLVVTLTLTLLKLTSGRLRPHFLAVCRPDVDLAACNRTQYISEYNCTNSATEEDRRRIFNARQSFPSGHAAFSVYMAVFIILYMERRIVTRHLLLLKLTSYVLLTSYAVWVGVTRVTDNMHHVMDVVGGNLLGLLMGLVTYFGAAYYYCSPNQQEGDEETGDNHDTSTNHHHNNNNNNVNRSDDDDDDDDVESGNLDHLETETPTTPTPLLFNGISLSSNSGLRIGPLRLEGDKHKFPRRATLQ